MKHSKQNRVNRGEIWLINLDPAQGSEIKKTRPAIILSRSDYNRVAGTVTVVPVSTGRFIESFHTRVSSLKNDSHAVIPQIRVASKDRLIKKMGKLREAEIHDLEGKVEFFLGLGGSA
jgi:mRNA interferase MazF